MGERAVFVYTQRATQVSGCCTEALATSESEPRSRSVLLVCETGEFKVDRAKRQTILTDLGKLDSQQISLRSDPGLLDKALDLLVDLRATIR
jgi:hypothetical protein